jgi:Protein of unknown function (DUF2012)
VSSWAQALEFIQLVSLLHGASKRRGLIDVHVDADELATASQVRLMLLLDGGERRSTWPRPDGSFIFYDVPAGPHMLETVSTNLVYPQVRFSRKFRCFCARATTRE